MNAPLTHDREWRIARLEAEASLLWSEIEPLLKAHDAVQAKLVELYEKEPK